MVKRQRTSLFHICLGLLAALVVHASVVWWARDVPWRIIKSPDRPVFSYCRIPLAPEPPYVFFILGELPQQRTANMDDRLDWNTRFETPRLEPGVSLAPRSAVYFDPESIDVSDRGINPFFSLQPCFF